MASPQLEDGHTRIANEILEAFCRIFPSNGSSARVLLTIIRRTYGWNKKEDQISISQIEAMTGLSRRAVIYALQNLEVQRFITVQRQRGRGNVNQVNTVSLQKNYELWVVQRKSPKYEKLLQKQREKYQVGVVQGKEGGAKNDKKVVQRIEKGSANCLHPQKTVIKDNNKRQYGEFKNVLLTDEEYQKLKDQLNTKTDEFIERLSGYIQSTGKRYKYKDHYATILNWYRRDKEGKVGKDKGRRLPTPKEYEPTADYPDL